MSQNEERGIIYTVLPRALTEVEYFVKLWKIRLSLGEAMLIGFTTAGLWIGGGLTGIAEWRLGYVKVEPTLYIIYLIVTVSAISIGHALRPEGSIELVIKGLIEPTKYLAVSSTGDQSWYPSLARPHYRHHRLKNISLSRGFQAIKKSFKPIGDPKKKKKAVKVKETEKDETSADE